MSENIPKALLITGIPEENHELLLDQISTSNWQTFTELAAIVTADYENAFRSNSITTREVVTCAQDLRKFLRNTCNIPLNDFVNREVACAQREPNRPAITEDDSMYTPFESDTEEIAGELHSWLRAQQEIANEGKDSATTPDSTDL